MTGWMRLAAGVTLRTLPLLVGIAQVTLAMDPREERAAEAPKCDAPEPVEIQGIENAFRLSPRLYSGSQPEGAESFAALKALGIKTILTVDGTEPDVEEAKKHGLRYVHLPIGYDGVPREQAVRAVKAIETLPGPVYVHCHHGKHRGPAMAAVCAMATEGWTDTQAITWLEQAGTSPDYPGLFASSREFRRPTPGELDQVGTTFPERVPVPDLVETMIQVDKVFDALKVSQKIGFRPPAGKADREPAHEGLQLLEAFREALRLDETRERGDEFVRQMKGAEGDAEALFQALKTDRDSPSPASHSRAEEAFRDMSRTCTTCHARYRNH